MKVSGDRTLWLTLSVFAAAYAFQSLSGLSVGFSEHGPSWGRAVYPFFHGAWWHALGNAVSVALFAVSLRRRHGVGGAFLWASAFLASWLATFGSEEAVPTVGASGILYAMVGMYSTFAMSGGWALTLLVLAAVNVLQYFLMRVNAPLHAFAFVYGFAAGLAFHAYRRYLEARGKI